MNEPEPEDHPTGTEPGGPANAAYPNIDWLFGIQRFGMRTGLDTMKRLLGRLGSPQRSFDVVLVGGTNGKGSVARLLAASLQGAGARTGLFTSPHLQRVGERALVDGSPSSDADIDRLLAAVKGEAEALGATFFEVVTAAALLRFVEAQVDIAVMEVGMGGRLDATNALDPDLSVITGVALDHTAVLGATVEAIAGEKAGILRRGVPTVTGAQGAALETIRGLAAELAAPLVVLGDEFRADQVESSWAGVSCELAWGTPTVRNLPQPLRQPGRLSLASPLVGRHQANNMAQAAMAALLLGVPPVAAQKALGSTAWPGRLERREHEGRYVVMDGAHNQQAAQALAAAISELEGQAAVLVVGMSGDKDVEAVLGELRGLANRIVFTRAVNSPRAEDPGSLLQVWQAVSGDIGAEDAEVAPDPCVALQRALAATEPGQTVVVAGSLFLVAEVSNLLDGVPGEPYERHQ